MNKPASFYSTAILCITMQLPYSAVIAGDSTRSATGVLSSQQRLAEMGNTKAQYKLGSMYEFGVGTEKNLPKARQWYTKASSNASIPAANRLIYLEVRKAGFNKNIHTGWLNKVMKETDAGNQQSAMLLGQLYSYGIGVKKDLNEALRLLNKAGVMGNPVVTYEIARVEKEIKSIARQERRQQNNIEKARQKEVKNIRQSDHKKVNQSDNKKANKTKIKGAKVDDVYAEKRRRYEEVMRKIKEEERIIEEQQAWAEGNRETL